MENITRTAYGSLLQTCEWLKRPYVVLENTTLNEKFGIQSRVLPAAGVYPSLGYLAIGNGGHKLGLGADALVAPDVTQHTARNAAPFKIMPFVLRETDNDLTAPERAKYALRREEDHGGVRYYAYYLKRLDLSQVTPSLEYIVIDGATKTVTEFVPTSADLNPVPTDLAPTGVNTVSGDYLSATAKVPVVFTPADMTELRNMAQILFGNDKYAIVSEVAMCTGVDKMVDSPAPGNSTIPFNEAIAVQTASFVSTFIPAKFMVTGFNMLLDMGSTEPLFRLQDPVV
jgi:hypothetical protein